MFDLDIINCKTHLGESSFYLYKTNEVVFLDLLDPKIFFYCLDSRTLIKYKIDLPKPLGNVYPLVNGGFLISSFAGIFYFNRKTQKLKKYLDIRKKNELENVSYNDGTISKNKIWVGLSHLNENKKLGYFGYIIKKKFYTVDENFIVSNGPAINDNLNNLYFSDSLNSKIYMYNLKNGKKNTIIKFNKRYGFPDGIALDNNNGLWVAHWGGSRVTRINLNNSKIDKEIKIPALNVTSISFVGKKTKSFIRYYC